MSLWWKLESLSAVWFSESNQLCLRSVRASYTIFPSIYIFFVIAAWTMISQDGTLPRQEMLKIFRFQYCKHSWLFSNLPDFLQPTEVPDSLFYNCARRCVCVFVNVFAHLFSYMFVCKQASSPSAPVSPLNVCLLVCVLVCHRPQRRSKPKRAWGFLFWGACVSCPICILSA